VFSTETKKYLKIGIIAALFVLLVVNFSHIFTFGQLILSAAAPLIVGCIIAYILNILLRKVESWYFPKSKSAFVLKSRRPVCILLSILILIVAAFLIINLVLPELILSFKLIGQEIPPFVESVRVWLLNQSSAMPELYDMLASLKFDWQSTLKKAVDFITAGVGGVITSVVSVVSTTIGVVTTAVIGIIFALYLLAGKERLLCQCDKIMRAYLKPQTRDRIVYIAATANRTFSAFIVGQVTEAIIIGILCTIGMLIFRFPYAAMTGAVVGVTALIPIVGAYIGAAVGAFMIFTQDPLQAVLFIVFLLILQQLEGNLIYPKVVGTSIGLPGIWVLAAVTIGSGIMGVPGMLLGVPAAATLYRLLGTDVNGRLKKQTAKNEIVSPPNPLPEKENSEKSENLPVSSNKRKKKK